MTDLLTDGKMIEIIISAEDVDNAERMQKRRNLLDAGMKSKNPSAKFDRESIDPYVRVIRRQGVTTNEEDDETRQYRVMRRYYR